MSDDLVKRLGESRAVWKNARPHPTDLEIEARDRITALLAERDAARAEVAVLLRDRNDLVAEVVSLRQALIGMVNTYPYSPPCHGWEAQVLAHRDAKNALANTTTPDPLTKTWNEAIEAAANVAWPSEEKPQEPYDKWGDQVADNGERHAALVSDMDAYELSNNIRALKKG